VLFGGPSSFTIAIEGEQLRVLARPERIGAEPVIAVVGVGTEVADAAMGRARTVLLLGGAPAIGVAGLGAWLLAGAALRPVARMRRRLADLTEHDSDARLDVPSTRDEIADLAVAMNTLLDRLRRALTRQRSFVADAGHELRTPLTSLKAELELAVRPGRSRQALADAVEAAAGDTDRLIRLAEDLLLLARTDEGAAFLRPEPVVLADLAAAAVRGAATAAHARALTVELVADRELRVVADPDRIRQALDNLLNNAVRHAPQGSTIEVTVCTDARGGVPAAVIEVRDRGPGFPPEFLPYAFERFRRADYGRTRNNGGSGLGLALVSSIAQAHGGSARADNHPDGGARVRIELVADPR
jgi:two-component system, OmpR family, sensor kinase